MKSKASDAPLFALGKSNSQDKSNEKNGNSDNNGGNSGNSDNNGGNSGNSDKNGGNKDINGGNKDNNGEKGGNSGSNDINGEKSDNNDVTSENSDGSKGNKGGIDNSNKGALNNDPAVKSDKDLDLQPGEFPGNETAFSKKNFYSFGRMFNKRKFAVDDYFDNAGSGFSGLTDEWVEVGTTEDLLSNDQGKKRLQSFVAFDSEIDPVIEGDMTVYSPEGGEIDIALSEDGIIYVRSEEEITERLEITYVMKKNKRSRSKDKATLFIDVDISKPVLELEPEPTEAPANEVVDSSEELSQLLSTVDVEL